MISGLQWTLARSSNRTLGAFFRRPCTIQEARYAHTPAHDLETFVKLLLYAFSLQIANSLDAMGEKYEDIRQWWEGEEKDGDLNLSALLPLARACDYDALKRKLRCITH